MANKEKLVSYYEHLCSVLNQNGYKMNGLTPEGKIGKVDYSVPDYDQPDYTMMEIVRDKEAYNFLLNRGHIDKTICYECGNSPINSTYTFTEPRNLITHNICADCHPQGNQQSSGGCAGLILVMIISSLSIAGLVIAI